MLFGDEVHQGIVDLFGVGPQQSVWCAVDLDEPRLRHGFGDGAAAVVDRQNKDRVEALSGRFHASSPVGSGTTLTATIPTGRK